MEIICLAHEALSMESGVCRCSVLVNPQPLVPEVHFSLPDPEEKGKDWPHRGTQGGRALTSFLLEHLLVPGPVLGLGVPVSWL